MGKIILSVILICAAIVMFVLAIRSLKGKGYLFNNAYIYASKEEREKMDKKPHYRQTGVCFLMISVILLLDGIDILTGINWLSYVAIAITVIVVIYAIVSSIKIEASSGKSEN